MSDKRKPTPEELLRIQEQFEQSGMDAQSRQAALLRFAEQNMNTSQRQNLQQLLQDKSALQKLLQSEQAQKLMQRLNKKP